ncbi:TPA: DUF551 domain-containing protein [Klebsiella pneumoniae]|uniref:DUF551 domain-containing protein n=1 Tax=Klebsiella pneumoniae TaxID=573 RepID=UPI000C33CBCD|nr:DUF551 domain-containing protein [Klebsiella pneumoniae]AUD16652.1 hypothetical protein CXB26_06755 [Klebsiella pneumoniae]AUD27519.1 hypothetical protein CXB24_06750 [Klebsiella pneumoniae]AUD33071.1 hypothetical protein CXB25_06750 [Klebsiella pneumoniae]HBY1171359.1 DUF551 domain-containing protein [Klebsiella pneumoniae]HBY1182551.1 DUF551 domain-containing protein [Klebsiella pneumoniae]
MSEFSRETLINIIETDHVQCGEASALARMALAAMDSESECLPLDYLQGHKDGLEWAAQLAEANHPETGDWLYDDPIELAKAIRKGPDMPPSQPVPVVLDDYQRLSELYHAQEKRLFKIARRIKGPAFDKYSHSPSQAIDVLEVAIFGEDDACRAAMLQAGNSPVIPDVMLKIGYMFITAEGGTAFSISDVPVPGMTLAGPVYAPAVKAGGQQNAPQNIPEIISGWIPVSERMPEREYVLAADFSGKHYSPCQPNTQVGIYADWFDDGNPTWDDGDGNDLHLKEVTHWIPLPAAPQEVK